MTYLEELAAEAFPVDDYDLGSQRQITAENDFYEALDIALTPAQRDAFDNYCLKATVEERIAEGLRLAGNRRD